MPNTVVSSNNDADANNFTSSNFSPFAYAHRAADYEPRAERFFGPDFSSHRALHFRLYLRRRLERLPRVRARDLFQRILPAVAKFVHSVP